MRRKFKKLPIDAIEVLEGRRDLTEENIEGLVESMGSVGLQSPICVRPGQDGGYILVTGRHRLEAARRVGWAKIGCVIVACDEIDAQLLEISENLHRAELSALERAEQIAKWVELVERRRVSIQSELKPRSGGRPESGQAHAARELGLSQPDVHRAVKVASITPEAKQAAKDAGLADNQSALLTASREDTPEAQVAKLADIAREKAAGPKPMSVEELLERVAHRVVALSRAEQIEFFSGVRRLEHDLAPRQPAPAIAAAPAASTEKPFTLSGFALKAALAEAAELLERVPMTPRGTKFHLAIRRDPRTNKGVVGDRGRARCRAGPDYGKVQSSSGAEMSRSTRRAARAEFKKSAKSGGLDTALITTGTSLAGHPHSELFQGAIDSWFANVAGRRPRCIVCRRQFGGSGNIFPMLFLLATAIDDPVQAGAAAVCDACWASCSVDEVEAAAARALARTAGGGRFIVD
ncbi:MULTISPECIES: ParB/RepB/Spo0J family partition protein [unclassified Bradyrhizobium]